MKLKEELKGSTVYVPSLDKNIEVIDDNIDLLASAKADVFESTTPKSTKSKREESSDGNNQ